MVESFRVGEVFAKSFKVLLANFIPFVAITALVQSPLIVYAVYHAQGMQSVDPARVESYSRTGDLIMRILEIFLTPIATGAVTFGTVQYLRGKTASVGECISVGISRLLPVLGVGLVAGLLTILGLIALVIPGFIVMCMLYVAVPAAVIERAGVDASVRRSAALTKGFRWRILGIILLVVLIQFAMGMAVAIAIPMSVETYLVSTLAILVVGIFAAAWQASAAAVSYYHLRSMKESIDIEQIAAVFD